MVNPFSFAAFLTTTIVLALLAGGCGDNGKGNTVSVDGPIRGSTATKLPPIADLTDANGFFTTATKTADLLSDPEQKINALAEVAKSQRQAGDASGVKATLAHMSEVANAVTDNKVKADVLPALAETQAAAGDIAAARQTAAKIKDSNVQSAAWGRVVAAQAESGDVSGAIATVGKAKFTAATDQFNALTAISTAAAARGDINGAKVVANKVEEHYRPKTYSDIANNLKMQGKTDAAEKMLSAAESSVDAIRDPKNPAYETANRAQALLSIAQVQMSWNRTSQARRTLQQAYALAAKAGAGSSGGFGMRDDLMGRLVSSLMVAGDNATALSAANAIKDSMMHEAYVASVKSGKPVIVPGTEQETAPQESPIVAQARKGDLAGAKKSLDAVVEPTQRALLLAQIGAALKK